MFGSLEEDIKKLDKKLVRVVCPFFKYKKSSLLELFIEEGTKLKIKLDCHNHILPIKLYFKFFLKNLSIPKVNSCDYHERKNKSIAFCCSCSTDICQTCFDQKHSKHFIKDYSSFNLDKKNIIIEYQNLLDIIIKLKEAITKIKNLNKKQKILFENIYLFFMIKKIIYLEYIEGSKKGNFSYACLNNVNYIRTISSDITIENIESILKLNSLDKIFQLILKLNKDYLLTSGKKIIFNEIFETKKIKLNNISKFVAGNSEYIITVSQKINIYSIKLNKLLLILEEKEQQKIIFHPNYLNSFLILSNNIIKIWEINEGEKTAKQLINIKNMDNIENIQFIPDNKYHILIRNNNEIKILDLEDLNNKKVLNIQTPISLCEFSQDGKILGCLKENLLTFYELENDNLNKKLLSEKCSKFYIRNNRHYNKYNLLLINIASIIYYNDILSDKFLKIQIAEISNSYYDNEFDFLYLLSDVLTIIRISDWSRILQIDINRYLYPLNSPKNKESPIIQEFISINKQNKILSKYSFTCPILFNEYYLKENETISDEYNLENEIISTKDYNQKFSFNSDDIDNKEISVKKYLKIPEILEELKNNYKYSLSKKKELAENELKKINEDDTTYNQYIQLIKIIIKDNVNKNVLLKYLSFLKNNDEKLKRYENIELYYDEIKYYSVCFTPKELVDNFNYKKQYDEKKEFILFLQTISNEKEKINSIISILENVEKNLTNFNQPIEFKNRELYFYMNKVIIALEILKYKNKNENERVRNILSSIKLIFDKGLFDDQDIIEDESKLSKLILIILRGQISTLAEYNLNILQKESTIQEKKIAMSKIDNSSWLIVKMIPGVRVDVSKIEIDKIDKKYNFNNILLSLKTEENFQDYELYNHENLMNFFEEKINFDRIKKFIKKIILSNCIKDAFSLLYEQKYKYPFDTEDEASNFIENYLEFIYLKDESAKGATNEFTLKTKIFLMKKEAKFPNEIILYKCLYPASFIKVFLRELYHEFYNFYYFHSNGSIPFSSPRKDDFKEREGGRYFEILLFGKKLLTINLIQAIYILNEKNYEKSLSNFKGDFLSLKEEELIINGEFSFLNSEISKLIERKENIINFSSSVCIVKESNSMQFSI